MAFSELDYLWRYPDVAAAVRAGTILSGEVHYNTFGRTEGRNGEPVAWFDEPYYRNANPDVDAAVSSGTISSGRAHFFAFGVTEDRHTSAAFDERGYLTANPDVAQAVASGAFQSGFQHFELFGQHEGRNYPAGPTLWLGSPGDDTIGADGLLRGYAGNDTLFSNASATMYGEDGDDNLSSFNRFQEWTGFAHGGSGNDTLGAAVMEGGSGNDIFRVGTLGFIYNKSPQTIRDFEDGKDSIAVRGYTWDSIRDHITYANGNATISGTYTTGPYGELVVVNEIATLLNVPPNTLDQSDFTFT